MTAPVIIPGIARDGSLFPIEKLRAHTDAVFHLAVSVFVFNEDGELLIQRRADGKYHCGGKWANTCCTHPHWQECSAASAGRRLHEELCFTVPLQERSVVEYQADVGSGLHEHEKVTVFTGVAPRSVGDIAPNPEEVSETRWVALDDLKAEIAERPDDFTPWFRIYLERFPDLTF
ncbi:isopentenyl-diphosphate delta-isomerase [Rhodobium gokarnense]|uniref:Isopentenyl-diphosphate delta-isomerase n=1 Tax=Rhodobium gokarnense TaxID=364296 RepID=A0ABT3HBK8_9HYPH|nr:isopentenyl-diphosphate delta-isomerase [Rhodobium gokarnense]MCW2307776.1 isopentenyl-diphosphate delta-isomerase [Rhodobium gokarnense]